MYVLQSSKEVKQKEKKRRKSNMDAIDFKKNNKIIKRERESEKLRFQILSLYSIEANDTDCGYFDRTL